MDVPHVYCLSIHADYQCRHSGACCTAGWPISVDGPLHARLASAVEAALSSTTAGPFAFSSRHGPARLARTESGACVFHLGGGMPGCSIHARLGDEFLPPSCRQFPRVALLDERGVHISLSHFCPTAASMLFRDDVTLDIVVDPPAFPRGCEYEGLDARAVLPPLLRTALLWDFEGYTTWERCGVELLGQPVAPEDAIEMLRQAATQIERWSPQRGALSDAVLHAFQSLQVEERPSAHWRTWAAVVNRYLAAKLLASWVPYQADRLTALVESLATAHATLVSEARRATDEGRRPIDRSCLIDAVRQTDLRLVHRVHSKVATNGA